MSAPLQNVRVLCVLCLVSAGWAFSFGLSAPLASLWLSEAGYSDSVVGLNTGIYYLGIAATAIAVPGLMRRLGRRCPALGFVLSAATVLLFPWGGGLVSWFVLRLINGIGGAMSLIPLETYVNRHSPEEQRSRNFGFYAVAIAVGWALGNGVGLQMFDGAPHAAFVLGSVVTMLALPGLWFALPWPCEPAAEPQERVSLPWRRSLLGLGSGWSQGFLEGTMVSLLPIYLLFVGLSKDQVSWLTSGIMIGVILFQVPVAWLADRLGRARVLLACHAVVLAGLIALPFCSRSPALPICLFFVGACSGAFYPLGLSLLGEQVRGAALARASACYLALNCLGSLIGPSVTGMVMEYFGKASMPASGLAACGLVLAVWLLFRERPAAEKARLRYVYREPRDAVRTAPPTSASLYPTNRVE
jgi:MFS family permease